MRYLSHQKQDYRSMVFFLQHLAGIIDRINKDIDTVILGMHAKADNPELIKAREMGIKIMSFPEYLYEQTKSKKRIVVAGSHGKTTTTAMIMHVLKFLGIKFDYMVGSLIDGL